MNVKNGKVKSFGLAVLSISVLSVPFATAAQRPADSGENGNITQLKSNTVVSSTVDPSNGDQNPYGLVIDNRPGTTTPGALYVSNFSDKNGTNGAGSTVERIQNGKPTTFSTGANGPAALAFAAKGPLWIANFGQVGTDGNVQVTKPNGASFGANGIITNRSVQGPWGQAFGTYTDASGNKQPTFFVTGAQNGTVAAMYGFTPPNFAGTTQFAVLGSGLAHTGSTANDVEGPQGLAWDAANHTLYVTDTADNSVRAFDWTGPNGMTEQGQGKLVYQGGALKKPVGIALNPVNGDLLVVNQGNNNLVELSLDGKGPKGKAHVVGQVVLDKTPVNPKTGAGSALFGLAATQDASGNLVVYYTDDNTNTVNKLSQ